MSEEKGDWKMAFVLLASAVAALLIFVWGSFKGYELTQREAVNEGHAIWIPDKDGEATFKWLPPCVPKKEEVKPCQKP